MIKCEISYKYGMMNVQPYDLLGQKLQLWLTQFCPGHSIEIIIKDFGPIRTENYIRSISFLTIEDFNLFRICFSGKLIIKQLDSK